MHVFAGFPPLRGGHSDDGFVDGSSGINPADAGDGPGGQNIGPRDRS